MNREFTHELFAKCYDDAMASFEKKDKINIQIHYQLWGSTTCGFPGVGGCAMTTAPTVVIRCGDVARIYHNGRFAYEMDATKPEYAKYLEEANFPGVSGKPKQSPKKPSLVEACKPIIEWGEKYNPVEDPTVVIELTREEYETLLEAIKNE